MKASSSAPTGGSWIGSDGSWSASCSSSVSDVLPGSSVMRSDLKRAMILSVMSWLLATTRKAGAMFNPTGRLPCARWPGAASPAG
ncbi:hypothetical protein G6F55_014176 [Rhizopus delemar]|nr:hypothetical protein G6F55_014176 [Rhizopus delemar]